MNEALTFDPKVYFRIVAETLLKNHGERALTYTEEALRKMRILGDDEGFELWTGIEEQIFEKIRENQIPQNAVIH